jgi:hypothetical protein
VQDVANILRARTVSTNGAELGSFSSATRPTDTAVTDLITAACNDVIDAIGNTDVPTDLQASAGSLAAIGTAMLVEMGYYPEQVNTGRSIYPQLALQYKDKLNRLQNAIVSEGGNRPTAEYQTPAGSFGGPPVPAGWILPTW